MNRPLHYSSALSVVGALIAGGFVPSGCNALPTKLESPGACGISLMIWSREPSEAKYEYFEVDRGTFGYGGGKDGLAMAPSWETPLSPDQCAALREIAQRGGWMSTDPPAAVPVLEGGDRLADVAVMWEGGQRQFAASGDDPSVREAVEMLSQIAAARFQRQLDRLPEAGKQPR